MSDQLSSSSSDQDEGEINRPNGHPLAPKRTKITKKKLYRFLQNRNEKEFIEKFPKYQIDPCDNGERNTSTDVIATLLTECIRSGMSTAFDVVLGSRYNKQQIDGTQPIEAALQCGDHIALRKLFSHKRLLIANAKELLTNRVFYESDDGVESLRVLLESERVRLNEEYSERSSPLHNAVKCRNWPAVALLLRHGAPLGIVNDRNEYIVDGIPAQVLRQHFDNCVTTTKHSAAETSFEIRMNYENFSFNPDFLKRYGTSLNMKLCENSINSIILHNQISVINTLAKSKEHRRLLLHPLISSFMFVRWQLLCGVFYLNLLCYVMFAVAIIWFSLLKHDGNHYLTYAIGIMSWIGICYVILRELVQFMMLPLKYFRSPSNYLELSMIVLVLVTLSQWRNPCDWHRYLDVVSILLVALELCVLMGSLPFLSMSQHMLMLREVTKNFLKSLALYSILIVTFSVCFRILFGHTIKSIKEGYHNFGNFFVAIGKTIIMLTGEFDASNIEFDNIYTYLIFLAFVVFLAIVLFNLINGLAIYDTQAIQAEAELYGSICRTKLLCRYEMFLTGQAMYMDFSRWRYLTRLYKFIADCYTKDNMIFRLIAIRPNDDNRIFLYTRDGKITDLATIKNRFVSTIENGIVRASLNVLDQKNVGQAEKRLQNIERKLNQILDNMRLS